MSEKGVIKEGKGISANHYQYFFDTTKPSLAPIDIAGSFSVWKVVLRPCIKVMNPITNEIDEM